MKFKSKARSLINLKLKSAKVPEIYCFKVSDYNNKNKKILNFIKKKFNGKVAVRSSSANEDNFKTSNAGKFQSFLNVNPKNLKSLEHSILNVIQSFGNKQKGNDEVFIQDMVKDVYISGVATSCDKDTYAPYYNINFTKNKDTSIVTSGKNGSESFIYFKHSKIKPKAKYLKKIINLIKELEKKFNYNFIDIEFILDKFNNLYLVQVRPIIKKSERFENFDFIKPLKKLEKKIKKLQTPHHELLGKKTAFGVMPDWNPAEIIGIKPKPLALSLYQELITDHIWSEQRKDYGYRNVGSNHLMANFFGTPYVDIRVDFNSWVPSKLNTKISEKLINFYLKKFSANKNLHDKVEFEILFTCYTPSSEKKIKIILNKNFTRFEIKKIIESLKVINLQSLKKFNDELKKIDLLKIKQEKIKNSKMYYIDKIYWLVEDCKRYGTLPFAGLARSAFIGTDILNSLKKEKILSHKKIEKIFENINTITSKIFSDWQKMSKEDFLNKHGHLRPNTYEITSLNYRDGYKSYFSKGTLKTTKKKNKKNKIQFSNFEKKQINKFLKSSKLKLNFDKFFFYITESIKLREYSKYVFSKSIDLIFQNIKILSKRLGISIHDVSFLKIHQITDLYYNLSHHNIKSSFKKEIEKNKFDYYFNTSFKLPETISSPTDIYYHFESQNKINFVSNKSTLSEIIFLRDKNIQMHNLHGKIVCIESADPGYDFIFIHQIKGLITKFGGVNSHMSVRCSELNMPAAIGVGEKKFNDIINSNKINLNCLEKKIEIFK